MVHGRLIERGLVLAQEVLRLGDRPTSRAWGSSIIRWQLSLVALSVRESTEGPPPALRVAARAGLVELRVVQLLLRPVRQWAGKPVRAALGVAQARRTGGYAVRPPRAGMRGIAQQRHSTPVAVRVSIDAALPVVRAADGAPLGLEPRSDEFLRGSSLFLFREVRGQQLVPRVGKGAEAASRATPSLVAEALSEEVWVVEELRRAVAKVASVSSCTCAAVVKLLRAGLAEVARPTSPCANRPAAVSATMVERAAAVVMRGGALDAARCCLELSQHPAHLLKFLVQVACSSSTALRALCASTPAVAPPPR
mmetsp:Transcript_86343/g.200791  ORF Transcript_86343/g.200791 Transcript_86343/m.200791 type:complete len:309 (+) Transcript_86343:1023-1949(+)